MHEFVQSNECEGGEEGGAMTFIEAAASAGSLGIRHDSWAPGLIVRWRTYGWEQYTPARGWELLLYPSLALGPRGILSLPILIAQGWSVEP